MCTISHQIFGTFSILVPTDCFISQIVCLIRTDMSFIYIYSLEMNGRLMRVQGAHVKIIKLPVYLKKAA